MQSACDCKQAHSCLHACMMSVIPCLSGMHLHAIFTVYDMGIAVYRCPGGHSAPVKAARGWPWGPTVRKGFMAARVFFCESTCNEPAAISHYIDQA